MKSWKRGCWIWATTALLTMMVVGCGGIEDDLLTVEVELDTISTIGLKGVTVEVALDEQDQQEIEDALDAVPGDIDGDIYIGGLKSGSYDPDTGIISVTPTRTGHLEVKIKLSNGIIAAESTGHTIDVFKPYPGFPTDIAMNPEGLDLDISNIADLGSLVTPWTDMETALGLLPSVTNAQFQTYLGGSNNFTAEQITYLEAIGVEADADLWVTGMATQEVVYYDDTEDLMFVVVEVSVDTSDAASHGYLVNPLFDPMAVVPADYVGTGAIVVYTISVTQNVINDLDSYNN